MERADGRVLALEVKLAAVVHNEDTRHLNSMSRSDLASRQAPKPLYNAPP